MLLRNKNRGLIWFKSYQSWTGKELKKICIGTWWLYTVYFVFSFTLEAKPLIIHVTLEMYYCHYRYKSTWSMYWTKYGYSIFSLFANNRTRHISFPLFICFPTKKQSLIHTVDNCSNRVVGPIWWGVPVFSKQRFANFPVLFWISFVGRPWSTSVGGMSILGSIPNLPLSGYMYYI